MMRLIVSAIFATATVLAVVLGALWSASSTVTLVRPLDEQRNTRTHPTASPGSSDQTPQQKSHAGPHVTCEGCEEAPRIRLDTPPKTSGGTTHRAAVLQRYTPEPYTVLGGGEAHPHELVQEILERQELGHLSYRVRVPTVTYTIEGQLASAGVYRVLPENIRLAQDVAVTLDFSIRYPILTDTQFQFLRENRDYHLVYGLIRGIVGHELLHEQRLREYMTMLIETLNRPITEPLTIAAASDAIFQKQAGERLQTILAGKLSAAQKRHEESHTSIDSQEKRQRITFTFEEEAAGEISPSLLAEFIGEGAFSFDLPEGSIPRPPVPIVPEK